jgi:hypothetical protein
MGRSIQQKSHVEMQNVMATAHLLIMATELGSFLGMRRSHFFY